LNHEKKSLSLLTSEWWILILFIWIALSIGWSIDPALTLRRAVALCGSTVMGVYFAGRYDVKTQLRLLAFALAIATVASLIAGLFFPQIGRTLVTGDWQGVFYPKNSLGRAMALAAVVFAVEIVCDRRFRLLFYLMLPCAVVLLILSHSATAIVILVAFFCCILPFRRAIAMPMHWAMLFLALIVTLATVGSIWVLDNSQAIMSWLGRDATLTGRVQLWLQVISFIKTREVLGFGYGAFWLSSYGDYVRAATRWDVPHAHNGFLDTILSLGMIGFGILALSIGATLVRALRKARVDRSIVGSWPLLYVIFTVLYNLDESSILMPNSLMWILYVSISLAAAKAHKDSILVRHLPIEHLQARNREPLTEPVALSPLV
jgi:exopolysaccharide production protein ExoQ